MKKNKLILLQLVIAFTLICTSVYAAFNTTLSLSASESDVKKGEEVTITLSLKDVESGTKIHSVEGYINYNKDIFEPLTVRSIEKSSENIVKIENEELKVTDITDQTSPRIPDVGITFNGSISPEKGDAKILIDFDKGVSTNADLLKIKFKVKSNASLGTVTNAISYKMDVTGENGDGITTKSVETSVNVTVVAGSSEKPENKPTNEPEKPENKPVNEPEKPENKPANNTADDTNTNKNTNTNTNKNTNTNTNKNTNTNTNKNTNTNTNKNTNTNTNKNTNSDSNNSKDNTDNTTAAKAIPATGSKVVVVPAIVLIVLAYISYNKYMKYKDI